MSAMPPIAIKLCEVAKLRHGPQPDSCNAAKQCSLDHFVGAGENRWRNGEAQCLSGLEINDKLVLIRCLDWQVGRLLSPEDAIYIAGCLPELANQISAV